MTPDDARRLLDALLDPVVDDAGALRVLVDHAVDHGGHDPDDEAEINGCEVCLAVQRARAVIAEASDGDG